jgi:hypothetical protein
MADSTSLRPGARLESVQYPIRVLFLCTGNSARSQIAEALLKKKCGDHFVVASAGTAPAQEVRPEAIAALRAIGIDWSALLAWRIDLMLALRPELLERLVLGDRLKAIATQVPPSHHLPPPEAP